MKLVALSPDMQTQLSALLDQAGPDQLFLDAPALAELRASLSGPGFVPRVYVGISGGVIQGATGNCEMQLVGGDYDTDGSTDDEQRFLRAFQSMAVIAEHYVSNDPEVCASLLSDALLDVEVDDERQSDGMAQ